MKQFFVQLQILLVGWQISKKKRLALEKEFNQILSEWNEQKGEMSSPCFALQ